MSKAAVRALPGSGLALLGPETAPSDIAGPGLLSEGTLEGASEVPSCGVAAPANANTFSTKPLQLLLFVSITASEFTSLCMQTRLSW